MKKTLQKTYNFLTGNIKDTVSENISQFNDLPDDVNRSQQNLRSLTDHKIAERMQLFRKANSVNETSENTIEILALACESFRRTMSIDIYPEQIIAAKAMSEKNVIEMQTGEGKTMVAVLAACLMSGTEGSVYVFTFNDYLAARDAEWMRQVYELLGYSVSAVTQKTDQNAKYDAYRSDIVYTTVKSVGFDYLKGTMAYTPEEMVLPGFHTAIIDEADAILIDEARNPLVFAGDSFYQTPDLYRVAAFTENLQEDDHYIIDEYSRNVYLSEQGVMMAEGYFDTESLYAKGSEALLTAINLSLQAKVLLQKDVDYIVEDGRIMLVDELTGRVVHDRKWQNGLQSAVEAKEGLTILSDGAMLNSITIQHLIRLFDRYCGMTGTAVQASDELADLYGLGVFVIPTHKPSQRTDLPDLIFTHKAAKVKAIVSTVREAHQRKQPVLIGTLTVKESEELRDILSSNGLGATVLNAKNDEEEAEIVRNAGLPGAITISTNMAGRGTDIKPGGDDPALREKTLAAGGLFVIGTNRHESQRIDNQLRGRSGRQGDPGITRFIISMEDPLMEKYRLRELLPVRLQNIASEQPVKDKTVISEIARAQRIIEGQLFEIRKTLCEYTGFVESLRQLHFSKRNEFLKAGQDPLEQYMLNQYDIHWSELLGSFQQIREGIAWERIAGRNPIREFMTQCDELYQQMELTLQQIQSEAEQNPELISPVKRPTSTWTYVINDNPSGDPLTLMLMDASNIGMQFDPTAGIAMAINKFFFSKKK